MCAEIGRGGQFGQLSLHLRLPAGDTGPEPAAEGATDQLQRAVLDPRVQLRVQNLRQEVRHLVRVQVRCGGRQVGW